MKRKYAPLGTLALVLGLALALLVVLPASNASAQVLDDFGTVLSKDGGRNDQPPGPNTGGLGGPGAEADPDDFDIDTVTWSYELVETPQESPRENWTLRLITIWIITFARLSLFRGR